MPGLIESAINFIGVDAGQAGLIAALIATVLYYKKALGVASVLQSVAGRLVFAAGVLALLMLTGIVPGLNVDVALEYATEAFSLGKSLFSMLPLPF